MVDAFSIVLSDIHFIGAFLQTVIIIMIGFLFRHYGLVSTADKKFLTTLIWKLAVPCFAFNAFMQDFNLNNFHSTIKVFFLAIIFYIFLIVIGRLLFIKKGKTISTIAGLFMAIGQTTLYSMPILNSVYQGRGGDEVMLYISTFSIVFRIFVYCIGFYMISGEEIHIKTLGPNLRKIFLTPIMIGMFLGIFVFLVQNHTPQVMIGDLSYSILRIDKTLPALYVTVISLSRLVTPLCMFLIGMTMGEANFSEAFKDQTAWIVAICRNFAAPTIVLLLCLLLHKSGLILFTEYSLAAIVIGFSAPCSVSLSVICAQYNKEDAFASRTCFLSTLITIISFPLMFVAYQMLAGIL